MARNYKNKTNRQAWSTKAMNDAVEAVISGNVGVRKLRTYFMFPSLLWKDMLENKEKP